ncbi:hypothetical protein GN958_ATG15783, partial [Phytophthora infestans]
VNPLVNCTDATSHYTRATDLLVYFTTGALISAFATITVIYVPRITVESQDASPYRRLHESPDLYGDIDANNSSKWTRSAVVEFIEHYLQQS